MVQVPYMKSQEITKIHKISQEITRNPRVTEFTVYAPRHVHAGACARVQTIKPVHISTVRKLGKPPSLIMRIMDCVMILFQRRLEQYIVDPERGGPKPSWSEALKVSH